MFGKHVCFATSVYSDNGDLVTSATSHSSYDKSSDSHRSTCSNSPEIAKHKLEGPLAWWSGYTPLDSWTPPMPAQIPRFKGLIGVEPYIRFKCKSALEASDPGLLKTRNAEYKLADEVRLSQEWTNDPITNRDIRYDMCFFGEFDEVTSMLADIHVLDMVHGHSHAVTAKASPQSQGLTNLDQLPLGRIQENGGSMDQSMYEDEGPDGSADDTAGSPMTDPYDCSWGNKSAAEYIIPGLVPTEQADPYDCRWEDRMDIETPGVKEVPQDFEHEDDSMKEGLGPGLPMVEEEDAYDCGWEDAMEIQPAASSMTLGDEEDPYNCGWEDRPDDGEVLTALVMALERPEDPYDCGWGNQQDDGTAPISSVAIEDLYDCGWEYEEDANGVSQVANLEDPYDCRWGNDDADNLDVVSRHDPSNKQKGRWMHSPTPMYGLDIIDLTSSSASQRSESKKRYEPMSIEILEVIDLTSDAGSSQWNAFQEAGRSMHRAIQRLNSIRTDQRNEDTQNMVTDNSSGIPDQLPAGMLRANRRLVAAYGEAQDRVTELSEDLVAIYRLLDIHRRIMDLLDAMITNLQQGDE
ncbi:uncharacterized protein F5147DRAFT_781518 [Suillus discolor]|uniref:Uncharacterized protein n=1 Tax=Suillus discolor TaxID=1912936 RepID=A0A9P7JLN2_9AGAM|nr:uncharacterized protein F5147DRAFT_781518 [Suillus discolor]KAG2086821.1 hypothetical protein F5147DRAFT_781518 [Suillus discolor]